MDITEEEIDKRIKVLNKFLSIMMPSKFIIKLDNGLKWDGNKENHFYKGQSIFKAPILIKKFVVSKGIEVIEKNLRENRDYTLQRIKESGLDLSIFNPQRT